MERRELNGKSLASKEGRETRVHRRLKALGGARSREITRISRAPEHRRRKGESPKGVLSPLLASNRLNGKLQERNKDFFLKGAKGRRRRSYESRSFKSQTGTSSPNP